MKKHRIVFDVDGVFVNFLQEISEHITEKHKKTRIKEYCLKQYNLNERFHNGIETEEFNSLKLDFEKHNKWQNIQTMPNIDLSQSIINNKHLEVFFVTSLPTHLFYDRLINLNNIFNNNIDKEQLFCVPLGESKKPFIKALQPNYFIEDNLHNIQDCKLASNHKSIWIDLKDSCYDKSNLNQNIYQVHSLNEGILKIKNELNLPLIKNETIEKKTHKTQIINNIVNK